MKYLRLIPRLLVLFAAAPCLADALHSFSSLSNGTNSDGANPAAGLTASGGVLYGTTVYGGARAAGTAFTITPGTGAFGVFHAFTNTPNAGNPEADLAVSGGQFLGTSFAGGSKSTGTLYTAQTNGTVTAVFSFAVVDAHTATNTGGAGPTTAVIAPSAIAYGVASGGGAFAKGVVYAVATNGSSSSVLHAFSGLDSDPGTNTDGATPFGNLVLSGATLYGTTSAGGAYGDGTVFCVDTNGSNFATLYSFTPMDPVTGTNDDGAVPSGGLTLVNGVLYGTAMAGGFGHSGVIFSIATNGLNFTVLHHFTTPTSGTNADGIRPVASLTASGTTLYGTASAGGSGGSGTLFSLDIGSSAFQTLYNFSAVNPSNGVNSDGAMPTGDVLLYANSLYVTTSDGGAGSAGTVFSLALPRLPAVITNIVINPDGTTTLSFLGSPGSTNVVLATTVPETGIWANVSTNVADVNGFWQWSDPDAGLYSKRFYRSFSR